MSDETMELRISNLEEARREQAVLNKAISDSLQRIELAVSRITDKACPQPGLCLQLQAMWKSKWEADKDRFVRIDERFLANDEWHKEHDSEINGKLDKLREAHEATKTVVLRATGAIGLLIFLMPLLVWALNIYVRTPHP